MTEVINSYDVELLTEAISEARHECDEMAGLSAARRIHDPEDPSDREWIVSLDEDPSNMTVILNDGAEDMPDDEMARLIAGCWDSDWDDIRKADAVGDYSLGSSDFEPRPYEP